MHNEKLAILNAMAKIPGVRDLDIPVEDIPDAAEFDALTAKFHAYLDASLQAGWGLDLDDIAEMPPSAREVPGPVSPTSAAKSHRTTIRIPGSVVAACRARALATGTKYQTVIIRTLKTASAGWVIPE